MMNSSANMTKLLSYSVNDDCEDPGCAYVVEESDGRRTCGAPRRPSSSYCPHHHSLCYIVGGSEAEVDRLREVEALASAVGGRRARRRLAPTRQFLTRLERAVRDFL
jgi:hypothetical protein